MSFTLYNTLTKTKETFKPINEGEIKLYLCGPTVYGLLHIGNFRGPIFFNFARNWMEHLGYKVNFVYNFTDIDDKIIDLSIKEGVDSLVVSERYIQAFKEDFKRLGLRPHTHNPKVTDFVPEIVDCIERIIANKKAYVVDGEVFYSIDSFKPYGNLSGKVLEDLNAGQRVEVDERKQNPHDFVLWKPSKKGEPSWPSPWGPGRPGWHIECSAMIRSILGDSIDIHGGGIDLIFPHHENEIAQGEACTGCKYCSYWMHNNFINMQGEKMSKSLGNIIPARVFMDEYHPEVLKFLILSTHYRSILNVSDEKIDQTFSSLIRVYRALKVAGEVSSFTTTDKGIVNKNFGDMLAKFDTAIAKSVSDDFATGELIAAIYEVVRSFNALNLDKKAKDINSAPTAKAFLAWISKYGQMMALFSEGPEKFLSEINAILVKRKNIDVGHVEDLISKRSLARDQKDWAQADTYRDELSKLGIEFSDTANGVVWSVKVD